MTMEQAIAGTGAEELDWDAVYADQAPRVYNYFRFRLGREADVEDLTARTCERAWRSRAQYRRDLAGFSTWLFKDDFLQRIRTEPPPDFLARLKSRLDLQPPPANAAPTHSTLKKTLLGLLLSGCVFAMTLILLSREGSEAPAPVAASNPQTTEAVTLPPKPEAAPKAIATKPPHTDRIVDTRPTTLSPPAYNYMTTRSLEPYLKLLFSSNPRGPTIVSSESALDVIARFCRPLKPDDATPGCVGHPSHDNLRIGHLRA